MTIKITTIEESYIDFWVDDIHYRMYREDFEAGKFSKLFGGFRSGYAKAVRGKQRQAVSQMVQQMVSNHITMAYIQ